MEPVRLGLIGCGVIGTHHLGAIAAAPFIKLIAVADLIEERVNRAADQYHTPKRYREGLDLLDDPEIEAVVLALPAVGRTALGLRAFARGKHLLTEKPVAMNAGVVRRLLRAQGDRVGACCSSRYRFTASAAATTAFLATGRLGRLRVVRCLAIHPAGKPPTGPLPEWRLKRELNGGGIAMNWGCYDLDYLLGITGWTLRPQWVLAGAWPVGAPFTAYAAPGSNAETHAAALALCEGGTVLAFERSEFAPVQPHTLWEIIGELGSLKLQMTPTADQQIVFAKPDPVAGVATEVVWAGKEDPTPIHHGPVQDFAQAIREGRPPRTTLAQALQVQELTDAIYASAAKARPIRLGRKP